MPYKEFEKKVYHSWMNLLLGAHTKSKILDDKYTDLILNHTENSVDIDQ